MINKYLSVLNGVEKLLWKPQSVSDPEKSKIKTILSEYLQYKLLEKCKENEREAIHSAWKQCMIDIFSAFSPLYHTTEDCTAFAINYVNRLKDLIGIVLQQKKESIGGSLWSHLQGFISQPKYRSKKSLKTTTSRAESYTS